MNVLLITSGNHEGIAMRNSRQNRWYACVLRGLAILAFVASLTTTSARAQAATSPSSTTDLAGRWRLRLEFGNAIELGDTTRGGGFVGGVLASFDLVPRLALQAGFSMEGGSAGIRVQHMTDRGWQFWFDGMAGFIGVTNLPRQTMWGFGGAIGTSLRVNDRFLLGPYLRYSHRLETALADRDLLAFGIQLDLVIARRSQSNP